MKLKKFNQWKVVVLMVAGIAFGLLMRLNMGILGLLVVIDGVILLSLLKTKVEDQIQDERLERLGEKAAATSFMVLMPVVGFTGIAIFLGARDPWSYLQSLGVVLGYVAILGIMIYLISFWYLTKKH